MFLPTCIKLQSLTPFLRVQMQYNKRCCPADNLFSERPLTDDPSESLLNEIPEWYDA